MSSVFPGAIDDFDTTRANNTPMLDNHKNDHNKIGDALEKIEAELGVNPSSSYASVAERLTAIVGGAPIDAVYVTTAANATLTNEQILSALFGRGTLASRPAASIGGRLYYVTDSGSERWTRDTGSTWEDCAPNLNQTLAPTASVSLNNQKITGLGTPTVGTDAVTKNYADTIVSGLDIKQSVRIATTAAGTLASSFENGDTVDGVALVTGDRILIKNQAAGADNGIYTVNASGAPTRATDADVSAEVTAGMFAFVEAGTVNGDQGWVLSTNNPITLGTTALVFTQFSGAGGYSPGGTDVALADGGTGASLVDPNADRIYFWDDSAGVTTWLTVGSGLSLTGTTITASGGGSLAIATKTTTYTLTTSDDVILADATSAPFTLTLPTAVGNGGTVFDIKLISSGANDVTVDANGSQTIDGALTFVLSGQYDSITVISDNANWWIK